MVEEWRAASTCGGSIATLSHAAQAEGQTTIDKTGNFTVKTHCNVFYLWRNKGNCLWAGGALQQNDP